MLFSVVGLTSVEISLLGREQLTGSVHSYTVTMHFALHIDV